MDSEGYPEESELEKIKTWDIKDTLGLIDFIEERWAYRKWGFEKTFAWENGDRIIKLNISTAGWSGNESMIDALLANNIFHMMFYYSWRRGGHYVFHIHPETLGFKLVTDYCKEKGICRQYVSKAKDKFEYLKWSPKKIYVREKV